MLPENLWARLAKSYYSSSLQRNFVSVNLSNQQEAACQHCEAPELGISSHVYFLRGRENNAHARASLKAKSHIGKIMIKEVMPQKREPKSARSLNIGNYCHDREFVTVVLFLTISVLERSSLCWWVPVYYCVLVWPDNSILRYRSSVHAKPLPVL